MQIHNFLPTLIQCLERWKEIPKEAEFLESYFAPMESQLREVFDGPGLYSELADLDWPAYRRNVLTMDPAREEARLRKHVLDVERLFEIKLQGDAVLFGSFFGMDGYARFNLGMHRVFLGVDESFAQGSYLDVLEVHELTHVVRESRHQVWEGWGLHPRMSHDEFVEKQPTAEHLFGEGFSCAVSEILVPGQEPWNYAYQDEAGLKQVFKHAASVDRAVHRELELGESGDWSRLYNPGSYQPKLPVFTHYVWGWQWAKSLLREKTFGSPKEIVEISSRQFLEAAKAFRLADVKNP
jgi:hypothetical protein